MKRNDFISFDAFSESGTAGNYEEVTIIRENGWIKTDVLTECKSYKTALRRFFKAIADIPALVDWYESMTEAAENGYFKMNDNMMADGTRNPSPCYAYEIEEVNEGVWYIFLNVREEAPANEPEEVKEVEPMKNIKTALAEYAAIVEGFATEYTNDTTAETVRAEHPELDFMDDDEIAKLLEHAKNKRNPAPAIMERPTAPQWYGKPGREPKTFYNDYHRAMWAYDLAANNGEPVTEPRYNAAVTLLNAVNRYAHADARQWERANSYERYANSERCTRDEEALNKRRESLQKRLATFGAHLENYGLYPTVCDSKNRRICSYGND